MLMEMVLVFVMNTKQILFVTIPAPAPLNYCVGWAVHQEYYLSCKRMDEKIYDTRYRSIET